MKITLRNRHETLGSRWTDWQSVPHLVAPAVPALQDKPAEVFILG
jgi:hypothetical protein